MERPIFVFSAGWRTGSTLVQRILCSHGDIMIWGEHNGILDGLAAAEKKIDELHKFSNKHMGEYRKKGSSGWIAVVNPPPERFRDGLKKLIEAYFRDSARELGKSRWGFKEVRYGLDTAEFLFELYPAARFFLLLRHPEDCLASARATSTFLIKEGILAKVGGPRAFLEHWARIATSFLDDWKRIPHSTLYYENLVKEPERTIREMADVLEVDPADFDPHVLEVPARLARAVSPIDG